MTRNLLIAAGILIAAAVIFYLVAFRRAPATDPRLAALVDTAERVCLSDTGSTSSATLQSRLEFVKGVSAGAGAGTARQETRGALASLSGSLQAEQDDHIRSCMQPFVARMLAIAS